MMVLRLPSRAVVLPLIPMSNPAGPPAPGDFYTDEWIDLAEYLELRPDGSFLTRVDGEGMIDAGIYPGDLLVVERGSEAKAGDIVIAIIGGHLTVMRLPHNHLHLVAIKEPETPADQPVWGVVKYAIHKM